MKSTSHWYLPISTISCLGNAIHHELRAHGDRRRSRLPAARRWWLHLAQIVDSGIHCPRNSWISGLIHKPLKCQQIPKSWRSLRSLRSQLSFCHQPASGFGLFWCVKNHRGTSKGGQFPIDLMRWWRSLCNLGNREANRSSVEKWWVHRNKWEFDSQNWDFTRQNSDLGNKKRWVRSPSSQIYQHQWNCRSQHSTNQIGNAYVNCHENEGNFPIHHRTWP